MPPAQLPEGRLDRLDEFLSAEDLAAAWFARPNGFAWLTRGSNVVDRAAPGGVAAAGYDGTRVAVVTDNIEAGRLREEELPDGVAVDTFDWHADSLADAVADRSPAPAAADFDVPGMERIEASSLRQPLTEGDVERYRALGRTVADALEAVCRSAAPDDTERAVAADLRGRLAAEGVDTPVALVGGETRAQQYRHFTPQDVPLGGYAVASVTAERDGLFASATRTVAFDPPEWLDDRHAAAARVEATALAATRAAGHDGGTAGDVFDAIREAYEESGHPGEWRNHHQGGAAGFAGREWVATPGAAAPVRLPMAYAWNPTVRGAKSEGTVLVDGEGYEPLTGVGGSADAWPTLTARAIGYDETFERPAVLGVA